jgi:hypothetical protein
MAAYASTVTLHTDGVERISRNLGLVVGKIDITNYNATTVEETTITRLFKTSGQSAFPKGILSLSVTSSENGYVLGFDKTTGKFKAYHGDNNNASDGPLVEVPDDTDLGTFDFFAIGFIAP